MSKFEDCIQEGDKVVYSDSLECMVNLSQLERVAKKMSVEDYIKAYTKNHSNKCIGWNGGECQTWYQPWLTPDHARAVAHIAVDEYKRQQKNQEFATFTRDEFNEELRMARKEVIEKAVKWLKDNLTNAPSGNLRASHYGTITKCELINDFRKALEEE